MRALSLLDLHSRSLLVMLPRKGIFTFKLQPIHTKTQTESFVSKSGFGACWAFSNFAQELNYLCLIDSEPVGQSWSWYTSIDAPLLVLSQVTIGELHVAASLVVVVSRSCGTYDTVAI
jgi:hypothetical protein